MDSDCGATGVGRCVNGVCVNNTTDGGTGGSDGGSSADGGSGGTPCQSGSQCQSGEVCYQLTCQLIPCNSTRPCPTQFTCGTQGFCQ